MTRPYREFAIAQAPEMGGVIIFQIRLRSRSEIFKSASNPAPAKSVLMLRLLLQLTEPDSAHYGSQPLVLTPNAKLRRKDLIYSYHSGKFAH